MFKPNNKKILNTFNISYFAELVLFININVWVFFLMNFSCTKPLQASLEFPLQNKERTTEGVRQLRLLPFFHFEQIEVDIYI